jgi:ABC-type cobalamin/Fe3+-siderophores transport system ATPase subunit
MATLGEITLVFGATGAEGEVPLRFPVRHINLLVGPNNAGKSLFLRELSGVNPRQRRESLWRSSREAKATKIIASVQWSAETLAELRTQLIEQAFEKAKYKRLGLPVQPWDELLGALDSAAERLKMLRHELEKKLSDMAGQQLPSELGELLALVPSAAFVIPVGVGLLVLSKSESRALALKPAEDPAQLEIHSESHQSLSPIIAGQLERELKAHWDFCTNILTFLRIDLPAIRFEDLIDPGLLGSVVLQKITSIPLLGEFIKRQFPNISALPQASPELVAQFDRMYELAELCFDPSPLERLSSRLKKRERKGSWSNPEVRSGLAENTLYLDGLTRLAMTQSAQLDGFDEDKPDAPPVLTLLKNLEDMEILREIVAKVLGAQLVIDMVSNAPRVVWKLAAEPPPAGAEGSYTESTNEFMRGAGGLDERSDGIHALVGMFAAIFAKSTDLVIIDEPEAFLHPPLIRKFARELGTISRENDWQIFIATHSADLLAGFVSSTADVNIVRLTFDDRQTACPATARLLDTPALRRLALDPLLRSESILAALFCEGAVICEAAADRTLYTEINERLLRHSGGHEGLDSCMFLNAENWQTTARMIQPLREMGVAAAAVLDADVLFGDDLQRVLSAAQIPDEPGEEKIRRKMLDRCKTLQHAVRARLEKVANGKERQLKHGVIATLVLDEREIFEGLINELAIYGVFIVPLGELECWLQPQGLTPPSSRKEKKKWLAEAIDRLGWDPDDARYVRPAEGDIWDFLRKIAAWITNPDRKGTAPRG